MDPMIGYGYGYGYGNEFINHYADPYGDQYQVDAHNFDPNEWDWQEDLRKGLIDIEWKSPRYAENWDYYHGRHPRRWLTDEMEKLFDRKLASNMTENWCKTAVNAPLKRLRFTGWSGAPDNILGQLRTIIDDNQFQLRQKDVYRHARVTHEAFIFTWLDDTKPGGYSLTLQDESNVSWYPQQAHTDPHHVVQLWIDDSEKERRWRATIYYSNHVVRLLGSKVNPSNTIPSARWFQVDAVEPGGLHGFDRVPVVKVDLGDGNNGLISDIKFIQDRINKLEANKMVAAEWGAFRRLAILTKQVIEDGDAEFRPNKPVILDPGDTTRAGESGSSPTSIWEGTATELANYDQSIDKEIDKLFTIASLPSHLRVQGDRPHGLGGASEDEDEGVFLESIEEMQDIMTETYRDLWGLIFGPEIAKLIEVQWHNPKPQSDLTDMAVVQAAVTAGVPLEIALVKYAAWDQEDVDELMAMKQADQAKVLAAQPVVVAPNVA